MIAISKHKYCFFTKKINLNYQSSITEEPKSICEGSLARDSTPNSPGDVFQESLQSSDHVKNMLNC